jgi:ABC-2 type transport system permease protein
VLFGIAISFAVRFISNLSAFWLFDHRGTMILAMILMNVFSGFLVPLRFFPNWARGGLLLNPLAFIIQFPVDIYLEKYRFASAIARLGLQTVWALALLALARLILLRGTRRLVIQGG